MNLAIRTVCTHSTGFIYGVTKHTEMRHMSVQHSHHDWSSVHPNTYLNIYRFVIYCKSILKHRKSTVYQEFIVVVYSYELLVLSLKEEILQQKKTAKVILTHKTNFYRIHSVWQNHVYCFLPHSKGHGHHSIRTTKIVIICISNDVNIVVTLQL